MPIADPPTLATLPWQGWLSLVTVAVATVAMARERLGPDLVMFCALAWLVVCGVISPDQALRGFSETAVVTIGVLFVCAAAMRETGALRLVSRWIFGNTQHPTAALLRLTLPTALFSAFMNNTPIVAMFIPMVRSYALRIGIAPSKLLIPLAYAAMLGGTCTLIGTSSNLVVSSQLARSGEVELGMLEIGWIGIPSTLIGLAYLLTLGRRLLPSHADLLQSVADDAREYLVEVELTPASPLVGETVEAAGLRHLQGLFLAELRRADGQVVVPVSPQDRLRAGDHLVFTGDAARIADLLNDHPGLKPLDDDLELEDRGLYEVVVSHRSRLVGRTVRAAEFRRRFDAAILAVHRAGERMGGRIGDITLQAGDTLVLAASPGFRRTFRNSAMFYLVSELPADLPVLHRRANLTLLTLVGLVVVPAVFGVPMLVSAMGALILLIVVFRAISVRGARASINWTVLVLIGSAFGVATALESSGAAGALGNALVGLTAPFGPRALLAAIYVLAVVFASFISNAAAAALLFPIAMTAAAVGGYDARPFALGLCMAASAGFSTPIGCQPNLLVYGPGGYRYLDFTRVGLPLNLVLGVVAIVGIPFLWPF